ncbi:MAG: alcohol dehydrogenase catalytic domain-containing protein [Woeseiaceae bacterium]
MTAAQYIGNKSFDVVTGNTVAPAPGEVRLDVGFVGICGTDMHIYHGVMDKRVAPPQVIGHEMSGVIAELGADVEGFAVGDRVVVRPLDYCGDCPACDAGHSHICHNLKFMGIDSPGALQSSWTVKSRTLHKLPDNVTMKQGALIEPLSVACHDVARARLVAGEKAVVLGGGPIGQLIAQVAKGIGAEVMISEVSDVRRKFAEQSGVKTVNPVDEDVKAVVDEWTGGKGADVVFEVTGVAPAVESMTELAAVRGRICMVAIHSAAPPVNLFHFFWKELEMVGARVYEAADFDQAIAMVANGDLDLEPLITSVNSIQDIGTAFSSMDGNPAGMKALIKCGGESHA